MISETLADVLPHAGRQVEPAGAAHGLVDGDGAVISWIEADRRTRNLASGLADLGVCRGDRVVVLHPKSAASFLAMHAVVRSGAVAVPLDPLGASDACVAVLKQVEPAVVIGAAAFLSRLVGDWLRDGSCPVVATGDAEELASLGLGPDRLRSLDALVEADTTAGSLPVIEPDDDAYIIFTSGSTGTPKGIVHTHRSAMAYATAAVSKHALGPASRLAGTSPLHTDMSTLELYAVPLAGATAVTVSELAVRFPASLAELIEKQAITHLYIVCFQLNELFRRGGIEARDLSALEHIAFAGEPMDPAALRALMAYFESCSFRNVYGPAEVNAVTSWVATGLPPVDQIVPIGSPWPDVRLKIVDAHGAEVAPGDQGELIAAAPTMMRGYWRQPEMTAAGMIETDGARWYRTGDVCRYDRGELQFIGRVDNQLKIRGVRIELEAVESTIEAMPTVMQAVCAAVPTESGADELAVFLVAEDGNDIDSRSLRKWCTGRLPSAAIPSILLQGSELPSLASGKLDRRLVREQIRTHNETS